MLAALSMADHGLFERMIELTFPSHTNAGASGNTDPHRVEVTQVIKGKTISTVLACKEMLMQEPPERLSDFYGTVSTFTIHGPDPHSNVIDMLTCDSSPKQVAS